MKDPVNSIENWLINKTGFGFTKEEKEYFLKIQKMHVLTQCKNIENKSKKNKKKFDI